MSDEVLTMLKDIKAKFKAYIEDSQAQSLELLEQNKKLSMQLIHAEHALKGIVNEFDSVVCREIAEKALNNMKGFK